ncbi:fluoride efflux transporter CrcB [Mycolicibacterium celeriflavum]|uniref:Fluoride-specific ion channel FluC n=1 Tax=Mycolicibacterium celeriflavum TaxID=1249101 RepID=A0A1X0BWG0_MYCCF|nr:fluoride efflux transporter CrcB [Mycolicibacterium celeriflavum]MCV7240671.1 fluoride efflux transporter CrcB [Mycolicibacterium celeriflavum]ORA48204.1 camphor resistance protein CrcB [Mycolicibacterium celeriflavum]BBY43518.1 putative fluoride ion transporter CrcB 2 [Mycolicibacterium celeriflavum]
MTVAVWAGVVALGGVGAVLRFLVDRAVARRLTGAFPSGILVVNVSGALLLGLLSGLSVGPTTALLGGVAFVGSYTTFSTWMLQTLELGADRRTVLAVANILVSLALGLAAAAVGWWIGAQL